MSNNFSTKMKNKIYKDNVALLYILCMYVLKLRYVEIKVKECLCVFFLEMFLFMKLDMNDWNVNFL